MKAMTPWARWARVGMAALVVLAVDLDGCASGGGSRGITSTDEPAPEMLEDLHLTSVSPGMQVRVILRGDSLVSGKFQGVSRMEPDAYARRVAEFRVARTDSTPLPAPGSWVRVRRKSNDDSALLDGFGYRSLELRWKTSSPPRLLRFDDLTAVTDSSGHVWTRDALEREVIRGQVPCFSVIEVETDSGAVQVPVDQVTSVAYRTPSGQWVLGALLFVTVAVVIVVLIGRTDKPSGPQCAGPGPTWNARGALALALRRSASMP